MEVDETFKSVRSDAGLLWWYVELQCGCKKNKETDIKKGQNVLVCGVFFFL